MRLERLSAGARRHARAEPKELAGGGGHCTVEIADPSALASKTLPAKMNQK